MFAKDTPDIGVEDIRYVCFYGDLMRTQLPKPGACGVFSLQVKYDPASRLKRTAALIIDDIQYNRKSCHDENEFRTVY